MLQAAQLTSGIAKGAKFALTNALEAFTFLLAISSLPISRKIMLMQFGYIADSRIVSTGIYRLCRKGFISQLKDKNKNILRILPLKRYDILGSTVALKINKATEKWDGKWRLVIYDIPEKQKTRRERLRRLLEVLGFGKVQDSCWVSTYDYSGIVYDFCKKENIESCVCLYEGKFFAGKNIDKLIEEAWNLKQIREDYNTIAEESNGLIEKISQRGCRFDGVCENYSRIYTFFKETAEKDPFLPEQFLLKWPHRKAVEKLKQFSVIALKKVNDFHKTLIL